jgi:hypothetical protein
MDETVGPLDGLKPLNRGNSIVLTPPTANIDPAVGVDHTVCAAQSQCDVTAQVIGVMLGIELEGQSNLSQDSLQAAFVYPSVRAIVDWGIGGTSFRAELDYLQGTQLSICAENIRIGAKYMKNTLPWNQSVETNAPSFRVSAGFGYNGIGRNSNPARLTELVQIEQQNDTQIVQIPQFAVSMTALVVDGGMSAQVYGFGSSYSIAWDPIGENQAVNDVQYNVENAFPLFNGARYVEVTNISDQGSPLIAFIIFGLSL